jgi:hypothetical protein
MPQYSNLDEETTEWRIFESVWPVFLRSIDLETSGIIGLKETAAEDVETAAEDVETALYGETADEDIETAEEDVEVADEDAATDKAAKETDAFSKFRISFRNYMESIHLSHPRNTLSRSEFTLCRSQLNRLLECLESFVTDGAIKAAATGMEFMIYWMVVAPGWSQMTGASTYLMTTVQAALQNHLGWFSVARGPNTTKHPYKKLEALAKLWKQQKDAAKYVRLNHPFNDLQNAIKAADAVLRTFKTSALPVKLLDITKVAESKWNNDKCQSISIMLYDSISIGSSGCTTHEAKLRLDEALLDSTDEPIKRELSLSPCIIDSQPNTARWRHGSFTWMQG